MGWLSDLFGAEETPKIQEVVKTVHDSGGRLRLKICLLNNGAYVYQEDAFNDRLGEPTWEAAKTGPDEGCETPEEALEAARQAIPWLNSVLE